MSFPLDLGGQPAGGLAGNPDFAQNSPIDFTVHVWIPDRCVPEKRIRGESGMTRAVGVTTVVLVRANGNSPHAACSG